jgi:cytochrome c oxidase subunit 4
MSGPGRVNRKPYWIVFAALAAMTLLEIVVANRSLGIPRGAVAVALISLAVTKAALVGLFYMHLKHEMRALKLTVALPFFFPALYALVLIGEASWRLMR